MNPEKQLFRIAFELGNAYMFTGGGLIQVKDVEQNRRFAAQFAAAFLMPEEAVRATVVQLGIKPDRWTYELLLRIKNRFGVSAEAFAHRLEEIGAVDKTLRQNLKARITEEYKMNGYAEPGTGRRELSRNGRFNDLALLAEIKRKHDQAPDAVQ